MAIIRSKYLLWLLLSIPGIAFTFGWLSGQGDAYELLHPTGEFAARFLIVSLMITPLQMMFPKRRWTLMLVRRRRYIGVAAFGYTVLHTLIYLQLTGKISVLIADLAALGIWTGWVATLVMVPLGLTSNNISQRWMKRSWKPLQRFTYIAALFTLLHWIWIHDEPGAAFANFLPLIVLELYRLWRMVSDRRQKLQQALA